jgi:exodeoxyribonuclease V alpha subunit
MKTFELKDEDDMSKITICYAMSVHKAQGSEYPNVIFFLEKRQHSSFLNQRMIYTALTRAKNKMYLVGSVTEIEQACGRPIPYVRDNIITKLH